MIFRPENQLLYRAAEQAILALFPDTEIRETKTQVGFFRGCGFAWASERGKRFILTIGGRERIRSPRIHQAAEPYPGRWTNHIILNSPEEMDDEIMGWISDAYEFAAERAFRRGKKE